MFPPTTKTHASPHPDGDASIRQTDTDAAHARLSAVSKGYITDDPWVRHLVPRAHLAKGRPPLINVGTYVRGRAVDGLVGGWLERVGREGGTTQIVSCGAGSDSRFWRVATGPYKDVLARYVEIDFAEVTGKKAMAIRKSRELSGVLGEDVRIVQGGTGLHSEKYHLVAADLRLGPSTTLGPLLFGSDTAEGILSASLPTLLLFECVLVYMEPGCSEALLGWFAERFAGTGAPLGGVVYEMFNLGDAFGRVMVSNLQVRGTVEIT
ncbi:hypothetical protein H0H87_004826 [Tephrocybe sp. NHM501043]|nr:hypothetical protein H0H87_004826 [Tephrocybe sp. NHM501043]